MNIDNKLENTRTILSELGNAVSNLVNSSPEVFEDKTIKNNLNDFRTAHAEATQRPPHSTLFIKMTVVQFSDLLR